MPGFPLDARNGAFSYLFIWFLLLVWVVSDTNGFRLSWVQSRPSGHCVPQFVPRIAAPVGRWHSASSSFVPLNAVHLISTKLHAFKRISTNLTPIVTPSEQELFDLLLQVVDDCKLNTTIRVAGGWVRDRLLRTGNQKFDVDLALENMTGAQFRHHLQSWLKTPKGKVPHLFRLSIIPQNSERSKHLETVTGSFGKIWLDIVHLRTENYTGTSRVPTVIHAAPLQDALRRDLTINALFYNLHTKKVEDYTGQGLDDLRQGLVRTPVPALFTLLDDPLRAFRAVRFASRHLFRMDPELVEACGHPTVHGKISTIISPERCSQEMIRMISGHAAALALSRLHQFGLLGCVVKIPSTLEERHDKPGKGTRMIREYVPVAPAKLKQLQRDLFPMGMSTFMIAHYMRQVCEEPPSEIVDSATAVGKLANHKIPTKALPYTKAFLRSIKNSDALWETFTYACLMSVLEDNKEGAYGILLEKMKMSSKLCRAVRQTTQSSQDYRVLLEKVISDIKAHPVELNTKAEKKRGVAYTGNAYHELTESTTSETSTLEEVGSSSPLDRLSHLLDLHDTPITTTSSVLHDFAVSAVVSGELTVPVMHGVISRMELGQVMRRAGEDYPFALYLAAAQLVRERAVKTMVHAMPSSMPNDQKVTNSLNTINRDFKLFSRIRDDPNTTQAPMRPQNAPFTIEDYAGVSLSHATCYKEELYKVLQAVEFLFDAGRRFQLAGVWNIQPIFQGNEVMAMFPKVPRGPVISEIQETQINWQLQNPTEPDEALKTYLRDKYCEYL